MRAWAAECVLQVQYVWSGTCATHMGSVQGLGCVMSVGTRMAFTVWKPGCVSYTYVLHIPASTHCICWDQDDVQHGDWGVHHTYMQCAETGMCDTYAGTGL